ncbi:MAG: DsbA family protein [Bdellovibrionales bacterium]
MKKISLKSALLALLFALPLSPACAATANAPAPALTDFALGNANAPVTIVEYASFTCSHCSHFYTDIMPRLQKEYIDTGKVRFIYRDFPSNRYDLIAGALTRCVSTEQFYPLVKTIFSNYQTWVQQPKPETVLIQYATLAGLSENKANTCKDDSKIFDALVERRTEAIKKYDITATPTFIFNESQDKLIGAVSYEEFAAHIDKLLKAK